MGMDAEREGEPLEKRVERVEIENGKIKSDMKKLEKMVSELAKSHAELLTEMRALVSGVNSAIDEMGVLHKLTVKQHATLQMIINGASNRDIAEVFGVTENTAKVHVRSLAKKLGVTSRSQIVAKALRPMEQITDAGYMAASKGLPKNWATEFCGKEDDPYRSLLARSDDAAGPAGN